MRSEDADGKPVRIGDRVKLSGTVESADGFLIRVRWDRHPEGHTVAEFVHAHCCEKVEG
jgi:hypothetical protein